MDLKKKLLLVLANLIIALPTTVLAMDDEYHAPDYDEIVAGISPQTGRIYNVIPSMGRDSFAWVQENSTPHFSATAYESLPSSHQLGDKVHYIHNQKKLGSCTGQALTQAMEIQLTGDNYRPLSPLFVYYNERRLEGTINKDSGASITDGIKVVAQYGACSEQLWPYTNYLETFTKEPTPDCYEDALKSVVLNYSHVDHTLEGIKSALFNGNAVVGGVAVFQSFESSEAEATGIIPMPKRGEKLLGGHAITFTGFDDHTKRLTFANSWSENWGDKGFGYLPYAYFMNSQLTMPSEVWSINAVGPKAS